MTYPDDADTIEIPLDVIRAYCALAQLFAQPRPTWADAVALARMTAGQEYKTRFIPG